MSFRQNAQLRCRRIVTLVRIRAVLARTDDVFKRSPVYSRETAGALNKPPGLRLRSLIVQRWGDRAASNQDRQSHRVLDVRGIDARSGRRARCRAGNRRRRRCELLGARLLRQLAATPAQPGFSFATIFYHADVSAGGDVAFARQVSHRNLTTNFTGSLNAHVSGTADLVLAAPAYTFEQKFLGAQAQIALLVPYGRLSATVDATLTGNLGLGGEGVRRARRRPSARRLERLADRRAVAGAARPGVTQEDDHQVVPVAGRSTRSLPQRGAVAQHDGARSPIADVLSRIEQRAVPL